jgi:hypothetical protein
MIDVAKIPPELAALKSWCLWKTIERGGKPTKVPYQPTDYEAKSDTPETWCSLDDALDRYGAGGYDGIGFMFGKEPSGFVGCDLDGCRDPETGKVEDWAREVITHMASYAEVSPSQTGVKIFMRGKSPFSTGKNLKLKDLPVIGVKEPGIEIYDHGRYFAVTGLRVRGPHDCQERQVELDWLKGKFWPDATPVQGGDFYGDDSVLERARKYIAKTEPAISGQNGSGAAFNVACKLVLGFGLSRDTALVLYREWNQTCKPPWSERELVHKIDDAAKQAGPRNYLRNVTPPNWSKAEEKIPAYREPSSNGKSKELRRSTMNDAAEKYIKHIENGGGQTVSLGLHDLDKALEGGVEPGELVLVAARPSHGKSMIAMQFVHYWCSREMPCMFISEEMTELMLGKKALQYISEHPKHEWTAPTVPDELRRELALYAKARKTCHIIEGCGSVDVAVAEIESGIKEHGINAVVIDYAQCLKSVGKNEYEQVTATSVALREMAHRNKGLVTIVLCHLGREIEKRKKFLPVLSDLKNSGQLEQDADVVMFLVWPWRLDKKQKPGEFQIFIAKNRNRAIIEPTVTVDFNADRQMLTNIIPENHEQAFDSYSTSEPSNPNDRFN